MAIERRGRCILFGRPACGANGHLWRDGDNQHGTGTAQLGAPFCPYGNVMETPMPVILWVGLPVLLIGGGLIYFIVR